MDHRAARSEFKRGLMLLRGRCPHMALPHMRRALALEENNPDYLSYFGVAIALAEKKWATAELYCRTALLSKQDEARFHVNLAQVYLGAGRWQCAVQTLKMGLQCAKRRCLLIRALCRLVVRRSPLLPFLGRKHFFNRYLGIVRHRILNFFKYGGKLASSEAHFLL